MDITRLRIMVILLMLITQSTSYSIEYTDCRNPTAVEQFDLSTMCSEKVPGGQKVDTKYILLQKATEVGTSGYSCSIRKTTFKLYCGAYSHVKLAEVPHIDVPQEMPASFCQSIVTTQGFNVPGGDRKPIKMNSETLLWADEVGLIKDQNGGVTCQGQQHRINGEIVEDVIVLTQYRIRVREERYLIKGGQIESETAHLALPCQAHMEGCVTAEATFTWKRPEEKCMLQEIQQIRAERVDEWAIDRERRILLEMKGTVTPPAECPMTTLYATEYDDIYLAESGTFSQLEVTNLRMDLEMASRDNYLSYMLESNLNGLDEQLTTALCEMKRSKQDDNPFHLQGELYGMIRGEILYRFKCKTNTALLREEQNCYDMVPLKTDPPGFMHPSTKLYTNVAAVVTCNTHFPLKVKAKEAWITINPKIKPETAPQAYQELHKTREHINMATAGIYTVTEQIAWENLVNYPAYHKALLTGLSVGACSGATGDCEKGAGITSYDFDNLIPSIDPGQFSVGTQIKKWVHEYGDWMALLVLIIWLIQLMLTLSTLVITWIQDGPTVVIAVIYTMFCSGKMNRDKVIRRRKRRNQGENVEEIHLQEPEPSERYAVPESGYMEPRGPAPMYTSPRTVRIR